MWILTWVNEWERYDNEHDTSVGETKLIISYSTFHIVLTFESEWNAVMWPTNRCFRSLQWPELDSWSNPNFFWFFFSNLGCSFYCGDHVQLHINASSWMIFCNKMKFGIVLTLHDEVVGPSYLASLLLQ